MDIHTVTIDICNMSKDIFNIRMEVSKNLP